MLKKFDALMEHLGSREDSLAMEVRELLIEAEGDLCWLECLRAAGVDNWSGYDDAQDMFSESGYGDDDDD